MSGLIKDTQILIKRISESKKEEIEFYPISKPPGLFHVYIEDLTNELILFKSNHSFQKDKDIFEGLLFPYIFVPTQELLIWSNDEFVPLQKIIKKFFPESNKMYYCPNKSLYQITTESGEISITENLHLSSHDHQPIYPKEMKVGMSILHTHLPIENPEINKKLKGDMITEIKITPFFRGFVYKVYVDPKKTKSTHFSTKSQLLVPFQ